MSLSGFFASFCRVYLPWNVALAAYGLFLCLTGRFWQRNTSPLLRRVGHGVAIHCSLLPPLLPISWILAERFPRAYAEMTIWQTLDADGNLTAVTLSQLDAKTLTLQ